MAHSLYICMSIQLESFQSHILNKLKNKVNINIVSAHCNITSCKEFAKTSKHKSGEIKKLDCNIMCIMCNWLTEVFQIPADEWQNSTLFHTCIPQGGWKKHAAEIFVSFLKVMAAWHISIFSLMWRQPHVGSKSSLLFHHPKIQWGDKFFVF